MSATLATAPVRLPAHRALTVARVQAMDAVNVLVLPWVVLGSALVINLLVWVLVEGAAEGGTGGISSLYGYSMAMVAVLVSRGFPYLVGMGVTRRSFLGGTALMLLAYAAVSSLALTALHGLEALTDGFGLGGRFFRVAWFTEVPAWQLPVVYALPMVFAAGLTLPFAAAYLRWRATGIVTLLAATALLVVVGLWAVGRVDGWAGLFAWFDSLGPLVLSALLALVGVLAGAGA